VAGAYAACVYSTGDLNPQDWDFTVASSAGGAPSEAVASGAKKQARRGARAGTPRAATGRHRCRALAVTDLPHRSALCALLRRAAAQVVLPALPTVAVDSAVAAQLAPPAAVAGGVVLAGVALQAGVRKLSDTLGRSARVALFGGVVVLVASKILGLL
jgi:hypothetical protein